MDTQYWILNTGYWILDTGYWILDTAGWKSKFFEMKSSTHVILNILTLSLSGLPALINISEWYTVKILGNVTEYPFGGEGPTPYYYKSAELYSTTSLIWGIAFLSVFVISTFVLLKGQKKWTTLTFSSTLLLLFVQYIHGQIYI